MAELQTPSAAAMFDANTEKKKPEKPDEELYKANLKKAEKEHAESMAKFNAVRAKLDIAQPKNKDSPSAKRRQELIAQLTEIRKEQAGGKSGRNQIFEQIKKLDEQLKSRIAEQKTARSRVSFKNVDEIDREIDRLDKQVNGGMMKLVDERKALTEISSLKKQRKGFAGFEESQKGIDDTKAKLKELRDSLDDPVAKALSEKYNKIQAELDEIKAEQDEAYKNISALRSERDKLYAEQQEKFAAVRKIKDENYQGKKAFQQWEYEGRQRARERQKAEREKYENEKRKERAERLLAEAKDPAYLDEIRRAESLLRYLDPTTTTTTAPLVAPSGLSASAQRTVDDSGLKGTRVIRKDEREDTYFMGTGGKKGKKGRKTTEGGAATPPASGKFSVPPSVMEDCSAMGIEPPMSPADIPTVTEKVKEKLAFWKADQKVQTDKNIAKAQKEIERLDSEAADAFTATPTVNGTSSKSKSEEPGFISSAVDAVTNAVSDAAETIKNATLDETKD
ncbi:MAG: hypothetical protein M1818_007118 [Claussenomyces sp. TS43310]|nr:MAG: hypothetical protein M1818_007118 [Claussenomyces sp. TS43310]